MKRMVKNSVIVILMFGTATYLPSCNKEETPPTPPVVETTNVSDITQTTALIEGTVTDNGGTELLIIGSCWSTSPNPTISSNKTSNITGSGSFTSSITGLTPDTKYYVRTYATNIAGTSYGNEFTFTTNDIIIKGSEIIFNPDLTYGAISDVNGNTYKTIQIGNQIWMAENLRTSKLNDGTLIPIIKSSIEWFTTPGYIWYNNGTSAHLADYGPLYNWFTVNTGKLCPSGWHVPSDTEWATLIISLGGGEIASSKLMETGTTHWLNPNSGATNSTGFTGLPGGFLFGDYNDFGESFDDVFTGLGYEGHWWLASDFVGTDYALIANIYSRDRDSNFITVTGTGQIRKNNGASVRCVKNNLF